MSHKTCDRCSEAFTRPDRLSAAQWASRRFCSKRCAGTRRAASDDDVRRLYANDNSCSQIATQIGITKTQVARILKEYGDLRAPSERLRLSHSRPEVKAKLSAASAGRPCSEEVKQALRERTGDNHPLWKGGVTFCGAYPAFTASPANGNDAGRSLHRVAAEQKEGRRLARNEHVHHVDLNKQNLDPSNLVVMPASDHARYHAKLSGLGRRKRA